MAYENEMMGPHMNAFKRIEAHAFADWSKQPEYGEYLKVNYINDSMHSCQSCHALPNLYETLLKAPNKNEDSLIAYINELHVPKINRAAGKQNLITGVDCMTCHYDGKRVVTNSSFKATGTADCPAYCKPKGSALFSSNNNCITCHKEEVTAMVKLPKALITETSCVKCHQEYDTEGKPTHYTYWHTNIANKPMPKHLAVYEDITASYNADSKEVVVIWNNTRLPHPLTRCTETLASLEVTDQNGKSKGKGEIRLNRRAEHYEVLQPFWPNKTVPGKNGLQIPLDGSTLRDTIRNVQTGAGGELQLRITGGHKEQYWLPDSTQVVSFRKTIKL